MTAPVITFRFKQSSATSASSAVYRLQVQRSRKRIVKTFFSIAVLIVAARMGEAQESARWARHAAAVTVIRDNWGIAHVHGKTDADAVFGMIYAQAEDDFPRIEANYLTNLGRTAEADGEQAIWKDLRAQLYVSDQELKANYARSPAPMRRLM